jgi:hypothetical protein
MCYDLPSIFGNANKYKRSAGIGRGTKYDFCKNVKHVPGPANYEKPSFVETGFKKKRGKTMGISRAVKSRYL